MHVRILVSQLSIFMTVFVCMSNMDGDLLLGDRINGWRSLIRRSHKRVIVCDLFLGDRING